MSVPNRRPDDVSNGLDRFAPSAPGDLARVDRPELNPLDWDAEAALALLSFGSDEDESVIVEPAPPSRLVAREALPVPAAVRRAVAPATVLAHPLPSPVLVAVPSITAPSVGVPDWLSRAARGVGTAVAATVAGVGRISAAFVRSLVSAATRTGIGLQQGILIALCVTGLGEAVWIGVRLAQGTIGARPRSTATATQVTAPPVQSDRPAASANAMKGKARLPPTVTFQRSPTLTPPAAASPGWLAVSAAVPIEIFERGRKLGNSWSGGVRLTPGHHELQLVNRALGIDALKAVDIAPGETASLTIETLSGFLNVNAMPWASVTIDGVAVGDTPLANLQLSAGTHDLLLTHPQLGDRRLTITVAAGQTQKIASDLRR